MSHESRYHEEKAARRRVYFTFAYGWRLRPCGACNGSGRYDHNGSPPCDCCDGTGKERHRGPLAAEQVRFRAAMNDAPRSVEEDIRRYCGLAPYHGQGNILRGDDSFAEDILARYPQTELNRACRLLQQPRQRWTKGARAEQVAPPTFPVRPLDLLEECDDNE